MGGWVGGCVFVAPFILAYGSRPFLVHVIVDTFRFTCAINVCQTIVHTAFRGRALRVGSRKEQSARMCVHGVCLDSTGDYWTANRKHDSSNRA